MRPRDGYISAVAGFTATTAVFRLQGGQYLMDFILAGTQTAKLQRLGPDGATFIDCMVALAVTSVSPLLNLVEGQYKILATTADAATVGLSRVPGE